MNPDRQFQWMSPTEELRVAFQLPAHVVEELDDLAGKLHQTRSQMYRWICLSFMESVLDKNEPPQVPAVLELARQAVGGNPALRKNTYQKDVS